MLSGGARSLVPAEPAPRRVVVVALPSTEGLDIVSTLDILFVANTVLKAWGARTPGYAAEVVAGRRGPVCTWSGLKLVSERPCRSVRGPIDTLIVGSVDDPRDARRDMALIRWLRRTASNTRRIASFCTGAFVLAEAGLLDGRRATTHWAFCDDLARRYPRIAVEPDPIFVRDGNVYTSAGSTAGMDLVLTLVEEDFGRRVALAVAQNLVLYLKRPGGQAQFSAQLSTQLAEREPLRDIQAWVAEHPADDLSVTALAQRATMSPRTFFRVFTREVGVTPARFVERTRVESARRLLEETPAGVEEIATRCGFGCAETMRAAFQRILAVSPQAYRSRFAAIGNGREAGAARNGNSVRRRSVS